MVIFSLSIYHGICRLSANTRPTAHMIVSCVNILRSTLKSEEINILRRNDEPALKGDDDSVDFDEKDTITETDKQVTHFDLEYLNNSKDAMDVKLRKYFDIMPKHAILANIMDPRAKLKFAVAQDTQNNSKVNTNTKRSSSSYLKKSQEDLFKETITEIFDQYYFIPADDLTETIGTTPTTSLTSNALFAPKRTLNAFEALFVSADDENNSSSPAAVVKVSIY